MRSSLSFFLIALSIVAGSWILGRAYNYKFKTRNTVTVVGSADYNFTSDLIVWSATFTKTSVELKDAYASLKQDEKQVRDYLSAHGITASEAIFSSIVIEKQYAYKYDDQGRQTSSTFNGYQLRQTVKLESQNIAQVEKISREITELLQSGIELSSQEPMYYYTKLSNLKIDLLSKAATDAYNRAKSIAQNAHSKLGNLRRASMGVFQITGQHSDENYSYGGTFNTTSKNKTASITVRLEYELD
ncbi:MAG: SIMPL domain-containing protein [Bacteroidetes bacterium]|nr:SIMPL domain-containing protein [Bacteroidota bacterium]MBS1741169.1 SIMPL domain-containing protein [Bacteroidota bacterium]MBS1776058.1 SIMPL domain-containing protein [Bacteroidota bacterium]